MKVANEMNYTGHAAIDCKKTDGMRIDLHVNHMQCFMHYVIHEKIKGSTSISSG